MQREPNHFNTIITKQGGTPHDWEKLLKILNTKPDE